MVYCRGDEGVESFVGARVSGGGGGFVHSGRAVACGEWLQGTAFSPWTETQLVLYESAFGEDS